MPTHQPSSYGYAFVWVLCCMRLECFVIPQDAINIVLMIEIEFRTHSVVASLAVRDSYNVAGVIFRVIRGGGCKPPPYIRCAHRGP